VQDFDFFNRVLTVHGKGGTTLEQNLPEHVARELELHLLEIAAQPDWYLLTPQKQRRYGQGALARRPIQPGPMLRTQGEGRDERTPEIGMGTSSTFCTR